MDPISIIAVASAALFSSFSKSIAKEAFERIGRYFKKSAKIKIVTSTGEIGTEDIRNLSDGRVQEIVNSLENLPSRTPSSTTSRE